MSHPRVLVIFNEPVLPKDHPDAASEHDVIEATAGVVKILNAAGFPTRQVGFSYDPRPLLDELRDHPTEVVFNMFEGLATQTGTEISVVGLLEWLNVPFTGSPSSAISLGRDKIRTKYLLQGAGLPTADFLVIDRAPSAPWPYGWPAIVKPACQDCSIGIDQGSVVTTQAELDQRVVYILDRYGPPVLVEAFVFGREFHANLIEEGDELFSVPLAELRFAYSAGQPYWPIYSYEAKWNEKSPEFQGTPIDSGVVLDSGPMDTVRRAAVEAYKLVGLRDYGRIDLRVSEDGTPYILEVNPNPYIHSDAIIDGLKMTGRSHAKFIENLIWSAVARGNAALPSGVPRREAAKI